MTLALSHLMIRAHAMHAPHQEGRARPSLFFDPDLRHSSMDSVGVHSLGSAAAQGGQDTSTEHANGSHFTGWDMGVQASQDAPHHVLVMLLV